MGLCVHSVISLIISIVSLFAFMFVVGASGTIKEVSRIIWYISSVACIIYPIFAKRYRKQHGQFGRRMEIAALCLAFWTFQFLLMYTLGTSDLINTALTIVFFVIYAKSSNNVVPIEEDAETEHKKPWILRPVAWLCAIVMMLALQFIAELLCLLGEYVFLWLDGLSTVAVVMLAMLFGGTFLGIYSYSAFILPSLAVMVCDKIYPSNHAFRYYFIGLYTIAGCAFLIYAAIVGAVKGGSMFWFYVRFGWLILTSIIMMVIGRSKAIERHNSCTGSLSDVN